MLKNFIRVAIRNILANKIFTLINVTGLAAGLAAALLILLWIQDELSYDRFHENADNIYRVEEDQFYSGRIYHVNVTPHPSGPVWRERIPEIMDQTRINRLPGLLVRNNEMAFYESNIAAADSGLFTMFTLPLIYGDQMSVLRAPHSIVLSETLAHKYFGDTNPVGKSLLLENKHSMMVTGVMRNIPGNSLLRLDAVLPYSFLREIGFTSNSWGSNSILTFLHLTESAVTDSINNKLTAVVREYLPETQTKFMVFPLKDIHLHSRFGFENGNGQVLAIYIFSLIGIFILLIACLNFINLSTARAANRAREIAIKKVTGASRGVIALQFMFESFLLVFTALLVAYVLVGLLLNIFNSISGKNFILSDILTLRYLLSSLLAGIAAGLISGIYPALFLSSVKPAAIFSGISITGKGNSRVRKSLVVLQFALSILISVAAIFMYLQLKFLQNKDLGYDKNNLICIPMAQDMRSKYYSFKDELLREPLIESVSASLRNPVMIGSNSGGARWDGKDPEKQVLIGTNAVDYDYLKTMKMELLSGRDFSREFPGDIAGDSTGNFLINEEVSRIMDIGDPTGRRFSFMGLNGTIVGVLKNFHFKGADQPIEPIAFALADTRYLNNILIRIKPGSTSESLKAVEGIWKVHYPDYPLRYTFIDQDYANLFRSQVRLTGLLKYFTILSVIIACLGLYGLSSYSAERRTNEIGIRKVMGADASHVVLAMSGEFIVLIIFALALALPAGWIIVEKLLGQFAFRIDINIHVFAIIAFAAVAVALMTVSFQAFRASRINPSEALRIQK